ncbi:MAG: hypothetical protein MJ116_03495 [Lachnospiraceae bacterium]|nr:hypothetical protein [Lachnospiraceae bacterium]
MKKKLLKSTLALTLAAGMLFGSVSIPGLSKNPVSIGVQEVQAAEPTNAEKMLKNLESLKVSAAAIMNDDPSFIDLINGSISSMKELAAIYNSGTLFLKMAGIMKDPTASKLMDIQYTLKDMNITMKDMNMQLGTILEKLKEMDVFMQESERTREVNVWLNTYSSFCTQYQEKMTEFMNMYNSHINMGIRDWYRNSMDSRKPISIFYANDAEGKKIQVYSYTDEADPDCSVDGYTILKDETVRFSKESIDRAMESAGSYNVDTARKNIINLMRAEISKEIDEGTLDAGKAFFENWATLSFYDKAMKKNSLAEEAYNAVTSAISRDKMENSDLSTQVSSKFNDFCNHITTIDSALDAEINSLKFTHGFEGEVKESVKNVIDSMNLTTGVFASMTLSMMHQSGIHTRFSIQQVLDHWTDVTEKIEKAKNTALTGYDNYCYITGTLVNFADRKMEYENSITTRFDNNTTTYQSNACRTTDILKEGDIIADPTRMTMLWHMSQEENKTLEEYLMDKKIDYPEYGAYELLAERTPWRDFSPSSGISMNAGFRCKSAGTDYWDPVFFCKVNEGNKSGVEDEYFDNCKYMTGTVFNVKNETMKSNEVLGAMAAYAESHWYWFRDEVYLMGNATSCKHEVNITDESQTYDKEGSHLRMTIQDVCTYSKSYGVLLLTNLPKKEKDIAMTPLSYDDICKEDTNLPELTPAVSEEHYYEVVNPDQDKSKLINGDTEGEEEMIPTEEEMIPTGEESMEPDKEPTTDPMSDPAFDLASDETTPQTTDGSTNKTTDGSTPQMIATHPEIGSMPIMKTEQKE